MKSVAVFLSSSDRVSSAFKEEAYLLGRGLAESGFKVVYGGASCGCMGELAKGVLSANGQLVGVIPEIDILTEVVQNELSEKVLVSSMSERKNKMLELADAFIAFPGGIGTLDEITDVLCAKAIESELSKNKPFLFYNYMGFWTPFL